jgi:hypothetical protein
LGGSVITVTGRHFGSEASRGYRNASYSGLHVIIGNAECQESRFVSDEIVICVGAMAGNGLVDVAVRVSDTFGTNRVVSDLSRRGVARGSFGLAAFLAGGKGIVGILSQASSPAKDDEHKVSAARPVNTMGTAVLLNGSNGTLQSHDPGSVLQANLIPFADAVCANASRLQNMTGVAFNVTKFCPHSNSTRWPVDFACDLISSVAESTSEYESVFLSLRIPVSNLLAICIPENRTATPQEEVEQEPLAQLEGLPINVEGTVRSILVFRGTLYLGGTFSGSARHVSPNIVALGKANGGSKTDVLHVGNGVDGAVNVMVEYRDMVLLGGTFTKAVGPSGVALRCGCLVAWDPMSQTWNMVGRTPISGAIFAILLYQGRVLVAGRFHFTAGQEVHNIAAHSGNVSEPGGWADVGGGLRGGYVAAMTGNDMEFYVGGTFVSFPTPPRVTVLCTGPHQNTLPQFSCTCRCLTGFGSRCWSALSR